MEREAMRGLEGYHSSFFRSMAVSLHKNFNIKFFFSYYNKKSSETSKKQKTSSTSCGYCALHRRYTPNTQLDALIPRVGNKKTMKTYRDNRFIRG